MTRMLFFCLAVIVFWIDAFGEDEGEKPVFRIEAILVEGTSSQLERASKEFGRAGIGCVTNLVQDEFCELVVFPTVDVSEGSECVVSDFHAFVRYATRFDHAGKPDVSSFDEKGIGARISVNVNAVDGNTIAVELSLSYVEPPEWSSFSTRYGKLFSPKFRTSMISMMNIELHDKTVITLGGLVNTSTGEEKVFFVKSSRLNAETRENQKKDILKAS